MNQETGTSTLGTIASASPGEQRVSTLVGDRLCIGCGYNLAGQAVLREPIYSMLIVRCPECGIVASIQEYPLLGRWAARWAFLLAAAWFLTLLLFLVGTSAVVYGVAQSAVESASTKYAIWLAEQQLEWIKQQQQSNLNPNIGWMQSQPPSAYMMADGTWWAAQNPDALFSKAGGWRAMIDPSFGWTWANFSPLLFAIGCFWSVALLRLRKASLVAFALLPIALAAVSNLIFGYWPNTIMRMYGWTYMITHASAQIGTPIVVLTLAYCFVMMSFGLLMGRMIVRGMVRLLLPPRLRGALAGLWIADGRQPPR
jgi:hypothetical protein